MIATTGAELIAVRGLSKHYGALRVLENVSTQIRKCEVISVIGPSGCGKSTFFAASTCWSGPARAGRRNRFSTAHKSQRPGLLSKKSHR